MAGAHLVEGAVPEVAGEGEDVGLVDHREMAPGTGGGRLEGEPHAALDAHAGVHRALGGHLVDGPLAQGAALAGVDPFGVLTHHHEVAVGGGEGAQVHVEVELEAELEQQAPLEHAGRDVGRPDGAQQDGVEAAELVENGIGQDLARALPAGGADVVVGDVEVDPGGTHDLQGLGHHFRTDPVTTDDADLVAHVQVSCPRRPSSTRADGGGTVASLDPMPETHLSPAAYERLRAELDDLTTRGRIDIAATIERARELGDLSENADYHAAREDQGRMEARIRQLQALLDQAVIVDDATRGGTIAPGSIVALRYEGDDDVERYLVGSIEERRDDLPVISPASPLGTMLLGCQAGETVEYSAPSGIMKVQILEVGA